MTKEERRLAREAYANGCAEQSIISNDMERCKQRAKARYPGEPRIITLSGGEHYRVYNGQLQYRDNSQIGWQVSHRLMADIKALADLIANPTDD